MMRFHSQNLTDDRLPTWRHGRAWWGRLHAEWWAFKPSGLLLVSASWDHIRLYFGSLCGLYFGTADHDHDRGAWEMAWNDGSLRLEHPWVRQMEWRAADPWWRKAIRLPLVDWLIGQMRCDVIDGETREVFVPMPEGSYRALAKRQTYVRARRWYWPVDRRASVWLDIPGGIPHSGKGENSWDCGDDGLWGCGGDTEEAAIAHAVESVLRSRKRHGHDSKDTGRVPAIVLNAGALSGRSD